MFAEEREEIHALEAQHPHVHVVRPVALAARSVITAAKIWTRNRP